MWCVTNFDKKPVAKRNNKEMEERKQKQNEKEVCCIERLSGLGAEPFNTSLNFGKMKSFC